MTNKRTDEPADPERDALMLKLEHLDLLDAYAAAKKDEAKDRAKYLSAKKAFSEHRTYWRQIGEAAGTRAPIGAIGATTNKESK